MTIAEAELRRNTAAIAMSDAIAIAAPARQKPRRTGQVSRMAVALHALDAAMIVARASHSLTSSQGWEPLTEPELYIS